MDKLSARVRARPSDQALVASDGAQLHGLHPSGFDPSRGAVEHCGEERTPFNARCVQCQFVWPVFYYPITADKLGAFVGVHCPMCAAGGCVCA